MAETLQPVTNPYAPPRAAVRDIAASYTSAVPADRGRRLGAAILDSVIFMGMAYLPFMLGVIMLGFAVDSGAAMKIVAGVVMFSGFGAWLWLTVSYMSRNGQSLAKKMLGIKVVRSDGSPVTIGRMIGLRNVPIIILSFIPFVGLVDALFIFGEAQQCLHDKIADTIVINA